MNDRTRTLSPAGQAIYRDLERGWRNMIPVATALREAAIALLAEYDIEVDDAIQATINLPDYMESELLAVADAIHAIETKELISPTTPVGNRWTPPLQALQLLAYMRASSAADADYEATAAENRERQQQHEQQKTEEASKTCGRGKQSTCAARRVYLGSNIYAGGCQRHLTPEEAAAAAAHYQLAVTSVDCPSCTSDATQQCRVDTQILHDGKFPRIRTYKGTGVHTRRLDLIDSEALHLATSGQ